MTARSIVAAFFALSFFVTAARAQETKVTVTDKDKQIEQLLDRVAQLEKKVADLEKKLGGGNAVAAAPQPTGQAPAKVFQSLQEKARARSMADRKTYSAEQLQEAESLYQPSNDRSRRGSPEVRASLEKLIAKFPKSNRTGCATLYLAQWASGEEREKLFKDAIEKYGDCYYLNGVQVGPYARFQLANYYDQTNQPDRAHEQREAIKKDTPDAVDHGGMLLVKQFDQ
jgi:hypothetical protein